MSKNNDELLPKSIVLFCTASECRLEQRYSWRQYWNYLRRQLFVLDTYATPHNRALNLVMASVHVWASSAAAAPVLAGACAGGNCGEPGRQERERERAGERRLRGTGQAGEGEGEGRRAATAGNRAGRRGKDGAQPIRRH